jgi:hypothetical protein
VKKKHVVHGVYFLTPLCLFSVIYGKESVEVSKKVICQLLEMTDGKNHLFDILTGVIPLLNTTAIVWAKKMGFKSLGILPCAVFCARLGYSVTGEYFYIERGKYHELV